MTTNNDLVNRFLLYLRAERGAEKRTLAAYEHDVRDFSVWFEKPLPDATRIDMQKYVSDSLKKVCARSVQRRRSCLRHFFRFLIDEEEIGIDPTRNLPVPKGWCDSTVTPP